MAIGSLVIMVFNGVMVGVFQYFFIERGLFWESFLAIWTHGALEISAIILSGGAGLTLGKGLLFPGTYSRFQAFKLSGMNGLKIIMGVAPITFFAAFIEGFLTRHTTIPDPIRFLFILLSFTFIFIYFFLYPRRVAKHFANEAPEKNNTLVYEPPIEFDPSEIYLTVKIITETFRLLLKNFVFFGKSLFFISLFCAVLIAYNPLNLFHYFDNINFTGADFFNYNEYPFLGIITIICIIGTTLITLFFLKKDLNPKKNDHLPSQSADIIRTGLTILSLASLFAFIIYTDVDFTFTVAQVLFPLLIFISCVSYFQKITFYESIGYARDLLSKSWSKFIVSAGVFALLSVIIYITTIYGLRILFIQDALVWVLTDDEIISGKISLGLVAFQSFLSFFLYLTLSIISNSLLFFTLKEAHTAEHLVSKIKTITINK
jgi:hypothetical protein